MKNRFNKYSILLSIILVLVMANIAFSDMILHYTFDDPVDSETAVDSSGNEFDG